MPVLFVKHEKEVMLFEMPDSHPLYIGSSADCDIHIDSPTVSHVHAVVINKNGIAGIKDLNSFNGTYLNDKQILRPTTLAHGDAVRIADVQIKFIKTESLKRHQADSPV